MACHFLARRLFPSTSNKILSTVGFETEESAKVHYGLVEVHWIQEDLHGLDRFGFGAFHVKQLMGQKPVVE